jgi:electron transport complex protein RnfA
MKEMAFILMSMVLVDNLVLSKFLGICPFLGVSKKMDSALGMSYAVIAVMVLATAATWPIYTYFLKPYGIEFLQTIVFILVIASLVQLIEMVLKKYAPGMHAGLGVYLPLITTNCAVLGIAILNLDNEYSFVQSLVNALGGGLGFLVALVLFSGIRKQLDSSNVPLAFRGIPATLIAASILALSFMGFTGVVDGIFM